MFQSRAVKRLFGMAMVATVLSLLSGHVAAQSTDWDAVVAAAKKEGKLVFYNGQAGWPEPIVAAKSFEAKYGIKVDILEVRAVELMERIRIEVSTNKIGGDVTLMGSTGTTPLGQ